MPQNSQEHEQDNSMIKQIIIIMFYYAMCSNVKTERTRWQTWNMQMHKIAA